MRLLSIVVLLGFVHIGAAEAQSAQSAVEILEAGWGGSAVPGTWTPVRLRVKAGASELRGLAEVVVEAELPTRSKAPPLRLPIGSYAHEIVLRSGETRQMTVWFPAEGAMAIRARLTQGRETRAEAEAPIKIARQGWPAIAVMAEGAAIARALRSIELPYQGLPIPVVVSELSPSEIPRSGRLLEAITGFVVEGSGPADLTAAQREAVLEWVRGGGHLVVTGGPAAAHALRVLPDGSLSLSGIEFRGAADISSLGAWVGRADMPRSAPISAFRAEGGALLAGTADRPLVWRTRMGRGSVTVLAIDAALEPMASWAGAPRLWQIALAPALIRSSNEAQANPRTQNLSGRLMNNAGMLPVDAHPGWRTAAGILILFALFVGPALYLVLRRLDRHEWRWIAVPVAALVLSAGAFFSGVNTGGKEGITNIASYIDIVDQGRHARQAAVASFYDPMVREVSLPLPADIPVRAATTAEASMFPLSAGMAAQADSGARPHGNFEAPFQVIDGADRRVRFNGSRFSLRQIFFERELPSVPRIRAEVTLQGGLLSGTVRNDSELPLDHAVVMVGTAVARLGAIAPGQSVPIRLDPEAEKGLHPYTPLSYLLFSNPKPARPASPNTYMHYSMAYDLPRDPETRRRARFVDRVMGRESGGSNWSVPLTLFAFTRAPTAGDVLRTTGKNNHELSLLRLPIELLLPEGQFVLPAAFNRPELMESTGMYNLSSMSYASNARMYPIELRGGAVTYAFRPPLPASARAETLTLKTEQIERSAIRARNQNPNTNSSITPGAAAAGVFSIYDWQRSAWLPLPEGSEHRLAADVFLGPGGEVRVRVAAEEDKLIVFLEPSLEIAGRATAERRP